MGISRREFLSLLGSLIGGWVLTMPKSSYFGEMGRMLDKINDLTEFRDIPDPEAGDGGADRARLNPSASAGTEGGSVRWRREIMNIPESERILNEIGHFNDIAPKSFVFDENKYSPPKHKLELSEWSATNRHLPIKIDLRVLNKPGKRSPQALKSVVEYTQFNSPRYVAAPGERITMCNIAAWDWSRALQLHLPHWIGETEMSANMLFRWVSHPQAGGIYGEGWQPVNPRAAQLLTNRGIPVFALAENSAPRRHGHVALVYPTQASDLNAELYFATVNNGRSHGGNGIKNLRDTFRRLRPTFFVHKNDFVVYQDS
jgi:hypothetical protein